jgi:hypothetical protein
MKIIKKLFWINVKYIMKIIKIGLFKELKNITKIIKKLSLKKENYIVIRILKK